MPVTLNNAVRKLLDEPVSAVLATVNPDGGPQTSVAWVARDDNDDLLISTADGRRKVLNLRRDPRASLIVHDPKDPLRYVEVRGAAAVTEDLGHELAVRLATEYEGAEAAEEFRLLPSEMVRVVVRITPERVVGTIAG
ncbi:PPOX class F420-dependent oxidoreductase [Streptomyces sp. NPDC058439]|uniref:PPOX class F420-dependent oxidoreductase n=1 Tax=Streptomyces sp. NPDC058439 TaxID=3346500 RepID=UPI00366647E5